MADPKASAAMVEALRRGQGSLSPTAKPVRLHPDEPGEPVHLEPVDETPVHLEPVEEAPPAKPGRRALARQ